MLGSCNQVRVSVFKSSLFETKEKESDWISTDVYVLQFRQNKENGSWLVFQTTAVETNETAGRKWTLCSRWTAGSPAAPTGRRALVNVIQPVDEVEQREGGREDDPRPPVDGVDVREVGDLDLQL